MNNRTLFKGQAVKSEMVVLMLEKWGLHPQLVEQAAVIDAGDLERPTEVRVPEQEYERAHEILYGESEYDRAEF